MREMFPLLCSIKITPKIYMALICLISSCESLISNKDFGCCLSYRMCCILVRD